MIFIADPDNYKEKEELYFKVRQAEGRIVSDTLLKKLPYVPATEVLFNEWRLRAKNYERLTEYLKRHYGQHINILDVGCGNGWMSNSLSMLGHNVVGLDLNIRELEQAEHVFSSSETLQWVYADILNDNPAHFSFDMILLSASCQYFPDITILTHRLKKLLREDGEIHLFDTIFYSQSGIDAAQQRSKHYYETLGYPDMINYYSHHTTTEIKKLGYRRVHPKFFGKALLQWWKYKR